MDNTSPHHNPDWLREKYVTEGLSTYDIAAILGVSPSSVYQRLKAFKIPTRPRGHNLAGADNYMQQPGVDNPFKGRKHSPETRAHLREKASVPKPYLRGKRNGMSGRTGAANPNYKDGSAPERQCLYARSEGREFLRIIRERDNHRCVRCGSAEKGKKAITVHHFKSWEDHEELRFDPDNAVILCNACHRWVHSKANVNRDYLR